VKKEKFEELLESAREGGRILRGEAKPSRVWKARADDVKQVRKKLGLSQREFALLFGINVATLRNWEQGRRRPEGPARVLLRVAAKNPRAVAQALRT